jgi:hypothetical protein
MGSFREFFEQQEFVEFAQQAVESGEAAGVPHQSWSAKKAEVLDIWKKLRPDLPIYIQPMKDGNDGGPSKSSYGEDGIRITGTWPFIASVLSRLKDILPYENDNTKLKLVFRGIDGNKSVPNRQTFAFYLNLQNRSKGKAGRPEALPGM